MAALDGAKVVVVVALSVDDHLVQGHRAQRRHDFVLVERAPRGRTVVTGADSSMVCSSHVSSFVGTALAVRGRRAVFLRGDGWRTSTACRIVSLEFKVFVVSTAGSRTGITAPCPAVWVICFATGPTVVAGDEELRIDSFRTPFSDGSAEVMFPAFGKTVGISTLFLCCGSASASVCSTVLDSVP